LIKVREIIPKEGDKPFIIVPGTEFKYSEEKEEKKLENVEK